MRTKIKELLEKKEISEEIFTICGWIKTIREQKNFVFIEINDGSSFSNMQVLLNKSCKDYEKIKEISTGSSVCIQGKLQESPGKQKYEIIAESIKIFGTCDDSYPLQKKRHSFEFLRNISHLRPRTNTQGAVARVRNALSFGIHKFFQERGFYYIQTPIITPLDCEGGGQLFKATTLEKKDDWDFSKDFFKKPTFLTVSGQLNAEAFACSLSNVYTFGPTFRAENSHTSRHLAEFWMVEPEMAFADLKDTVKIAQEFLQYILKHVLKNCMEDLKFFDKFIEKDLLKKLIHTMESDLKTIEYTDAIKILLQSNQSFEFKVKWGIDLQAEHERFLCEKYFKQPIAIINYPKDIKAFYMRDNEDNKTVAAMDILVPKTGEIIGGSQREERYKILKKKIKEKNLNKEDYSWYLDLRKYGTVPHSGFGLGFERMGQFITGMENIRDIIPFPRYPGHADF